ncbi:MAG: hypothetical protein SGJ11_08355 [Phycisphaerae bacterium]|nr:hypothetical protein [Phycisphaerae bacterium]
MSTQFGGTVRHFGETRRSRLASLVGGCIAAFSVATVGSADVIANPQSSYTSETTCNTANTGWTCTNSCCCDVGVAGGGGTPAAPHKLQTGVQFAPASAGMPEVLVTDQFGNPIAITGKLLKFNPSDITTQKLNEQYGTLSSDHVWFGFESNVEITAPVGTSAVVYRVTFTWPVPVAATGSTWFSDNGDDLHGDIVIDAFNAIPAAPGTPHIDGGAGVEYGPPIAVQNVQTNFGDSNLGNLEFANGSELDAGYGFIDETTGYLWITLAGNLESNFNKLDIFLDYRDGGQNRLRGDNPDVDFNGLNRMGDDGSGNGLTFDSSFAADLFLTTTCGGQPFATFASYAHMFTEGGGSGGFIGSGGAGPDAVLYGSNGVLLALNNSNTGGVGGGTNRANGKGVITGVELQIPLILLQDYVGGDVKVSAFINGGGHDFVSNQVLGGLGGGTGNLGEPRNVNFNNHPGEQHFVIHGAGVACVGDFDGTSVVDGADLAILLGGWGGPGGDLTGDGTTDGADLATLLGAWGNCPTR